LSGVSVHHATFVSVASSTRTLPSVSRNAPADAKNGGWVIIAVQKPEVIGGAPVAARKSGAYKTGGSGCDSNGAPGGVAIACGGWSDCIREAVAREAASDAPRTVTQNNPATIAQIVIAPIRALPRG
jgi:hypothetical protein